MTDSNETVPATTDTDMSDLEPEQLPKPSGRRSVKAAARRATRSAVLEPETVVTLSALETGEAVAVEAVSAALAAAGFLDGLPDGDTFPKAYRRLQRYLGYGRNPTGQPDAGSLKWLSLRTKLFTTTD